VHPAATKGPEHLALHPFGRVPVLSHGDFVVYETQAILRYIDRVLPTPALTPADAKDAARMDQLLNVNDWYVFQGGGAMIGFQRVVGPRLMGSTPDEAKIAEALPRAKPAMDELARALADKAFFVGDALSLADVMIGPQIDFLRQTPEWEALAGAHPALAAWGDRMEARPSFAKTTWDRVDEMAAEAA
jgi:glutathione S-transferase